MRRVRGEGRVFRRKDSVYYSCAYYLRGKEYRLVKTIIVKDAPVIEIYRR